MKKYKGVEVKAEVELNKIEAKSLDEFIARAKEAEMHGFEFIQIIGVAGITVVPLQNLKEDVAKFVVEGLVSAMNNAVDGTR